MRLPLSSRTIHGMKSCWPSGSGESGLRGLGFGGAKVMLNSSEEDRADVMTVRR